MKFHILVGQRHEAYEGEYAPEALAVIDDWGDSDNPDYMKDEFAKVKASGEFSAVAVLQVVVNHDAVMRILRPAAEPIRGEIVNPAAQAKE